VIIFISKWSAVGSLPFLPFLPSALFVLLSVAFVASPMPSVFRRAKSGPRLQASTHSGLVAEDEVIPSRRPYGSKDLRLSFEGRVSTSIGMFSQVLAEEMPEEMPAAIGIGDVSSPTVVTADEGAADNMNESDDDLADVLAREKRMAKRQRQWRKWSEDVIPALLQPYMALLRETQGLREIDSKRQPNSCTGCLGGRLLDVTCVYFQSRLIIQCLFYFYMLIIM